jgi:RNA recognition motif-containing protein
MMDKMTNRSRGFGFVWFNSRAGMEDAIRDKHNAEIDGRRISVKEAIPQEQIPPGEPCMFDAHVVWCSVSSLSVQASQSRRPSAIPQEQIPPGELPTTNDSTWPAKQTSSVTRPGSCCVVLSIWFVCASCALRYQPQACLCVPCCESCKQ